MEGQQTFLKAMALPWVVRQVRRFIPQPDISFFIEDGTLHSKSTSLGMTTEEIYKDGAESKKIVEGVTTSVTYSWKDDILTYVAKKLTEEANEEQAFSRRWVEEDGVTMCARSLFRKKKEDVF